MYSESKQYQHWLFHIYKRFYVAEEWFESIFKVCLVDSSSSRWACMHYLDKPASWGIAKSCQQTSRYLCSENAISPELFVIYSLKKTCIPEMKEFAPNWGRCPFPFNTLLISKEQGKGSDYLIMSVGNWF